MSQEKPVTAELRPLERLARLHGIQLEYEDIESVIHKASPESLKATLAAVGVDASTDAAVAAALERAEDARWEGLCDGVFVRAQSDFPCSLALRLPLARGAQPADVPSRLKVVFEVTDESGRTWQIEGDTSAARVTQTRAKGADRLVWCEVPMPEGLDVGYYDFIVRANLGRKTFKQAVRVAICPDRAWLPPELEGQGRRAGLAIALYGLRSEKNWGIGDFGDLKALVRWAAEALDVDVIGLNPLHAIANRQPYNISPYYPISRYYRNFVYLCVPEMEDYKASEEAQRLVASEPFRHQLAEARAVEKVPYEKVAFLKMNVLRRAFQHFLEHCWGAREEHPRRAEFEAYIAREGALLDGYATFCALNEHFMAKDEGIWVWCEWPEEFHDPDSKAVAKWREEHWQEVLFHKWLQWQIEKQLGEVQALARSLGSAVGLYHDLALGVDPSGADAWLSRKYLVWDATVGAPPDPLAPQGQDWAFHPANRDAYRADAYRLFIQEIRSNCRHGGALRIDHVMRLFRLFWILKGKTAADGLYVENYADDLIRLLALESVRNRTLIIGEDLGTVPDNCRQSLNRFGICSYCVFQFERDKAGNLRPPSAYPELALATVTTHDMPPLAAFWTFQDIELRNRLGLVGGEQAFFDAINHRKWDKRKILEGLVAAGLLHPGYLSNPEDIYEMTGDIHNAITGFLVSTPARLTVISQEDLLKSTEQQNVPGIVDDYENWSTRMRYTIEQLRTEPLVAGCAAMYRNWIQRSGRGRKTP